MQLFAEKFAKKLAQIFYGSYLDLLTLQEGKLTGALDRENSYSKKIDSAVSPLDSVARETLLKQLKGELMRVPSSEMCEKLIFV